MGATDALAGTAVDNSRIIATIMPCGRLPLPQFPVSLLVKLSNSRGLGGFPFILGISRDGRVARLHSYELPLKPLPAPLSPIRAILRALTHLPCPSFRLVRMAKTRTGRGGSRPALEPLSNLRGCDVQHGSACWVRAYIGTSATTFQGRYGPRQPKVTTHLLP